MGKKKVYGTCAICGQHRKLTFEHFPPKGAFNSDKIKHYPVDEILQAKIMPWELEKVKYKGITQQGLGSHITCEKCNSNLGSWYADEYVNFAHIVASVLTNLKDEIKPADPHIYIKDAKIKPLNFFKQVVALFVYLHGDKNGEFQKNAREFLLNKENKTFDFTKYRISMYFLEKGYRATPCSGIGSFTDGGITMKFVSEFAFPPLGFVLEFNPGGKQTYGADISCLANYDYNVEGLIELSVPLRQINGVFPTDYRTRQEIIDCVETNKKKYGK